MNDRYWFEINLDNPHRAVLSKFVSMRSPGKPPTGHVIKLSDPVGDRKGVVIRHTCDARTKSDVLCLTNSTGDEEVISRDIFPYRSKVFAYPGLLVAKFVERNNSVKVFLQRLSIIVAWGGWTGIVKSPSFTLNLRPRAIGVQYMWAASEQTQGCWQFTLMAGGVRRQ